MNLTYKILWFEDQRDFVDVYISDLKKYIERLGFQFINPHVETDNSNTDTINYNEYDLILMDYKLSDGNKGDSIINRIRELNIFTEVVFYSSTNLEELRLTIQKNELDGVFCVSRSEAAFLPKVKDIINLTLRKVLDLNALRGIVMATVSDFDEKMLEIIDMYKEYLGEKESLVFMQERKSNLEKSLINRVEKVTKLDISDFYKDYSFDTSHKWRAVLNIVKDKLPHLKDLTASFKKDIIDIRNPLAHVKEVEDPKDSSKKCLSSDNFIFDDEKSKEILNNLKKHDENFDKILNHFKGKK